MSNPSEDHTVPEHSKRCHEGFFGQFFRWGGCHNAGRIVVGFGCIDGDGLIYVACAGAVAGSSGSQVLALNGILSGRLKRIGGRCSIHVLGEAAFVRALSAVVGGFRHASQSVLWHFSHTTGV